MLVWIHTWNNQDQYTYAEQLTYQQFENLLGHSGNWDLFYVGF